MSNLYADGWRQGSVVECELEATHLTIDAIDDGVNPITQTYSSWMVCTQDCDLHNAELEANEPLIELRPILSDERLRDWGVRNRHFVVAPGRCIDANAVRCLVTPSLLGSLALGRKDGLNEERRRFFKTWLGLRYDRPAVPEQLIPLARQIAARCSDRSGRDISSRVHDVLMQFDPSQTPVRFVLFGIVDKSDDKSEVRSWLADVGNRIDAKLGIMSDAIVETRSDTPLQVVEESYSADLSQLTWSRRKPEASS